jgi:RNA polymerase II C-terminal domain phosphatase-like 3/4
LEADVKSLAFKKDINAKKQQTGTGPGTTAPVVSNISNRKPTLPKLDLSGVSRNRPVSPILDLHADYDENSLPSPTRDNTAPLPLPKPVGFVPGTIPLAQPVIFNNPGSGTKLQPYITDAFKAVSTYQQRYGKSTVFVTDDLPSPTPSDEEKCKKDFEGTTGEASSAPVSATSETLAASLPVPQSAPVKQAGMRSTPKSRDPRLKLISPETRGGLTGPIPNSDFRKKKAPEESLTDESAVKRQRNGSGKGGWFEEAIDRPLQPNNIANFNQQSTGACPTVSIPTILKDMAVNPTMLVKLLQQKLASDSQLKTITNNPPPRSTPGPAPAPAPAPPPPPPPPPLIPTNVPATKPAETVSNSNISAARVKQPLPQPAAPIRMKPRDPRRVLHNGTASLATVLVKPNGPPSADRATFREQAEPAGNITSGLKAGPDMAPSESGSPWGNVEYLLDGYNDDQKAAIQRERARRIAEQNKMFAAKKLCLVLDLDHTLLNSAKVYISGSLFSLF